MQKGVTQWLNQNYLSVQHARQARMQKPFAHAVLKEFFSTKRIQQVASALRKERFYEKESDLFAFQQTNDLKKTKKPALKELYRFFSSAQFTQYIGKLMRTKLRKSVDMAGFVYDSCDYLLPHDDRLEGRKVAYVLNLSRGFKKRDGGTLELFATKKGRPVRVVKQISPRFNTLVLFNVTPKSFHHVREVVSNKKRVSIGGWFHG